MNQTSKSLFMLCSVLLLAPACAAYQPEPLSPNHPAHVHAAVAAVPARSQTLAYTPADVPTTRPSSTTNYSEAGAQAGLNTVTAEGKVVAAVPSSGQIVLEHGEIKGFMDAMTMGYRVESPTLLEGLKFGDRVRFTIDAAKKTIVKVEKLP